MKHKSVIACLAAGFLVLACGDDDEKADPSTVPGPTNGSDAGTSSRSDAGKTDAGSDDSNTGSCMPTGGGSQDYGNCTEAEVKEYETCFEDACKDELATCYGANYKKGDFEGPCGDYLSCVSECDCDDAECATACTRSSECTSCLISVGTCGTSCISKLSCVTDALGDAGIDLADADLDLGDATIPDFGKTCADLQDCCDTLSGDQKDSCILVHDTYVMQGGSSADVSCSAALSAVYCP